MQAEDGDRSDAVVARHVERGLEPAEIGRTEHGAVGADPLVDLDGPLSRSGSTMWRSNMRGRFWKAMRSASQSLVSRPARSARHVVRAAVLATVVPIRTDSRASVGTVAASRIPRIARMPATAASCIAPGLREQFVRDQPAVRTQRDNVGERAAAVDPELPARRSHVRARGQRARS